LFVSVVESGEQALSGVTSVQDWWTWSQGPLINILSADNHYHSLVRHAVNNIIDNIHCLFVIH